MNPRRTIAQHPALLLAALALLLALGALSSLGYALTLSRQVRAALQVVPPAPDKAADASKDSGKQEAKDKKDEKGKKGEKDEKDKKEDPERKGRGGKDKKSEGGGSLPDALQKLLKDRPLFGSPPRQQEPKLESILGDSALINGQWIRLGEQNGPIKLLEIRAYKVAVEWEGQRRELTLWSDLPIGGEGGGSASSPQMGDSGRSGGPGKKDRPNRNEKNVGKAPTASSERELQVRERVMMTGPSGGAIQLSEEDMKNLKIQSAEGGVVVIQEQK